MPGAASLLGAPRGLAGPPTQGREDPLLGLLFTSPTSQALQATSGPPCLLWLPGLGYPPPRMHGVSVDPSIILSGNRRDPDQPPAQ